MLYTLPKAAHNKYSYPLLVQDTSCCTEKRVALRLWIGLSLVGYMRSKEDCGRRNISEQCDAARQEEVGSFVHGNYSEATTGSCRKGAAR